MTRPAWRGVLEDLRRAASPRGRARLGRFAIEGLRLHERALRAGAGLDVVLAAEAFAADPSPRVRALLAALGEGGVPVRVAPDASVAELTEGREIGAVLGLVRFPADADPAVGLERGGPGGRLLVAVEVEDPGNVGALVRTALAAGAAGFVAVGASDPFHPRAVRTSMGSVFQLPVHRCRAAGPLVRRLRPLGVRCVGTVASGGTPLPRLALEGRHVAVFVGSEAFGLERGVIDGLDAAVTVPMAPGVDSFSVNAAAAIVLYELGRRLGRLQG